MVMHHSNRSETRTWLPNNQGQRIHTCWAHPRHEYVPHWSECGSGVWHGPRRWRRPCCSPHAHTHTASPPCGTAGVSSGSPGESRPWSSLQTGGRWTGQKEHSIRNPASRTQGLPSTPFPSLSCGTHSHISLYLYLHTTRGSGVQSTKRVMDPLDLDLQWLWAAMLVLGSEPGSLEELQLL